MENVLVSVIIPAYNAALTIKDSVASVIEQTYSNVEIIIVNDGSTDQTEMTLNEISNQYSNIIVINQKNGGVSSARNKGMDIAKGDFLLFVDSDDQIKPHTIETLLNNYKDNNELIAFEFDFNGNGQYLVENIQRPDYQQIISMKELAENYWHYYKMGIINSPCNKMYSRMIVEKYNIRFPIKMKMGEDLLFNLEYFQQIENILYINDQLYIYNQHELQATSNTDLQFRDDMIIFLQEIRKFITNHTEWVPKICNEYYNQVYSHLITALRNVFNLKSEEQLFYEEYILETCRLFDNIFNKMNYKASNYMEKWLLNDIKNYNIKNIYYKLYLFQKVLTLIKRR